MTEEEIDHEIERRTELVTRIAKHFGWTVKHICWPVEGAYFASQTSNEFKLDGGAMHSLIAWIEKGQTT
jgi:hypothetical protein